MITFNESGKRVRVFPAEKESSPIIYLNNYADAGEKIYDMTLRDGCPDYTLVAIDNLNWDHDMTPWQMPAAARRGEPGGGADDYLRFMLDTIVPAAESHINGSPVWRGIVGYSLGGLFALYSLYRTDLFTRMASVSGSMWFDGIKEFVLSEKCVGVPRRVYFSVGDRESGSPKSVFHSVIENTKDIEACFRGRGTESVFVLNSGNHNRDCQKRTADGITWLLKK